MATFNEDLPHIYPFDRQVASQVASQVEINGIVAKKSDLIMIEDSQPAEKPMEEPMVESLPTIPNMPDPVENHDEPDD
jgi:hypothetical protein